MTARAIILVGVDGRVQRWDDGAEQLFGYPPERALGERVDFLVPEHLREAHWRGFERAMAAPEIKDMAADMPVLCADGEVRVFAGRLLALSDGLGSAVGAVAVYTDEAEVGFTPFG